MAEREGFEPSVRLKSVHYDDDVYTHAMNFPVQELISDPAGVVPSVSLYSVLQPG